MIKICDCIIYDYNEINEGYEDISEKLAKETRNTWQSDRSDAEKLDNTRQGKKAEQAIHLYIWQRGTNANYIPYDAFRDNLKGPAPFDGVLYNKEKVSKETLLRILRKINSEVAAREWHGHISMGLRGEMHAAGVFSVEIKSTKVREKQRKLSNFRDYNDSDGIVNFIRVICKDDFLTYPYYIREGDFSWSEYIEYAKGKNPAFSALSGRTLSDAVKDFELANMDDFYIRVYMDEVKKKTLILGYMEKNILMCEPNLKKMILPNKSEKALYIARTLYERESLDNLISLIEKG